MSWLAHHSESERLASEAEVALRRGDRDAAKALYGKSAAEEVAALAFLGADKPRTLGITAVSAAALWYHAGQLHEAEREAHRALTLPGLPRFAVAELRTLLQSIWNESAQQAAGLTFVPGQVLVSVKGGQVLHGGEQMKKNMFAYTATKPSYPEYASLNKCQNGEIELTVRGEANEGQCGDTVALVLPRKALLDLFEALREELTPPMMKATGQSI